MGPRTRCGLIPPQNEIHGRFGDHHAAIGSARLGPNSCRDPKSNRDAIGLGFTAD